MTIRWCQAAQNTLPRRRGNDFTREWHPDAGVKAVKYTKSLKTKSARLCHAASCRRPRLCAFGYGCQRWAPMRGEVSELAVV